MLDPEQAGRFFRDAWIRGVRTHYPGEPKDSYTNPWERMDDWEQQSAIAVYQQVSAFIQAGAQGDQIVQLTREQGGRLVRIAWVAQMHKHFTDPKPAYVCSWEDMEHQWEREIDMDIYQAIASEVQQELKQAQV